ncbi:MAG: helix-turn-helix transcriptional regulator [Acetobacteraceae bacterium]
MSAVKDIPLHNPEQLGRAVRIKRIERSLSQRALAALLGVERKWVIHLEAGNPKAELGLVLKALGELDIRISLSESVEQSGHSRSIAPKPSRIDEVLRRLQRPRNE